MTLEAQHRRPAQRKTPRRTATEDNGSLAEEIDMLRGLLQRTLASPIDEDNLSELLHTLDTLSKVCLRVSNLIRAERKLENNEHLSSALNNALSQILSDLDQE